MVADMQNMLYFIYSIFIYMYIYVFLLVLSERWIILVTCKLNFREEVHFID